MKLLARNKQTVYYRNLKKSEPVATSVGGETLYTGEYTKTYDTLKSVKCYVKSAIGVNQAEPFGDFTSKRRTMYLEPKAADINEYSLLWVGIDPTPDLLGEPTIPHNFTVDGIAKGLNHTRITIRQVEVKTDGTISS